MSSRVRLVTAPAGVLNGKKVAEPGEERFICLIAAAAAAAAADDDDVGV